MDDLGKYLKRSKYKAGTYGAALASTNDKAHRLASKIYRVREGSNVGKANQRAAVDRSKAAEGGNMDKAKRLHNSL